MKIYDKEEIEIYQEAYNKWGEDVQMLMAIEEASELIKSITKYWRSGNVDKYNLHEEIADVEIMIEQLKIMHDDTEIIKIKEEKLKKMYHMLYD